MMVVDASALIAYVRGEPGADRVAELAKDGLVSSFNLAETYSRLNDLNEFGPSECKLRLKSLNLTISDFSEADAEAVADLRAATRQFGLSLGDRACLALASKRKLAVLTGDRKWAELDLGVEVQLIR